MSHTSTYEPYKLYNKGCPILGQPFCYIYSELSDDSDLPGGSKTRLEALLGSAEGIERYRKRTEEGRESRTSITPLPLNK